MVISDIGTQPIPASIIGHPDLQLGYSFQMLEKLHIFPHELDVNNQPCFKEYRVPMGLNGFVSRGSHSGFTLLRPIPIESPYI